jgi:hypothetical protein
MGEILPMYMSTSRFLANKDAFFFVSALPLMAIAKIPFAGLDEVEVVNVTAKCFHQQFTRSLHDFEVLIFGLKERQTDSGIAGWTTGIRHE